jgi:hypothetical protein
MGFQVPETTFFFDWPSIAVSDLDLLRRTVKLPNSVDVVTLKARVERPCGKRKQKWLEWSRRSGYLLRLMSRVEAGDTKDVFRVKT